MFSCPCCRGDCPPHPKAPWQCEYGGPFSGYVDSTTYYGDIGALEREQAAKYGVGRPESYASKSGATTVKEVQNWARNR